MRALLAVGTLLLGYGCIADQVAFEPLFTEEDRVQEPEIAGTWASEDADDPWLATIRASDGDYELVPVEDGRPQRPIGVRLGRIGERLYWDAVPRPVEGNDGWAEVQLLPLHSIARVTLCADRLLVAPLRSEWVEDALDGGRLDTPYARVGGDIVLTGTTTQLQRLVAEHASDEGAFGEYGQGVDCESDTDGVVVLHRVSAASSQAAADR